MAKGKLLCSPGDSENFQDLLPKPKPPGKIFVISEDLDLHCGGRNYNHVISSDQYLPNLNAVWKHLQWFCPWIFVPSRLRADVRSSRRGAGSGRLVWAGHCGEHNRFKQTWSLCPQVPLLLPFTISFSQIINGDSYSIKKKKKMFMPSICQPFPLFPKLDQLGKLIWKEHKFTKEIKCSLLWQPEPRVQ